ncbi:MAG: Flp pilus assembly complex ATPase component TadA, partial [Planctomycetales bacterium]|nr:Flp pilus assembly complex ATPase component TadA [Planctomycetales bacterium]
LYFMWTKTTDWVNRDCQTLKLPYTVWNSVAFWPFFLGLALAFTIPVFAGGFAALLLFYFVPLGIYVVKRNGVVDPHERVCTPAHVRYMFSKAAREGGGINVASEKKAKHEKGAPVVMTSVAEDANKKQAHQIKARQSEGYVPAKQIIADIVDQRADKAMMDYGREAVEIKFQIDGVWHESEPQDRESGDLVLEAFKSIAGLKVEDRRNRQSGSFIAEYKGHKYRTSILSQGTKSGERVVLQVAQPHTKFESLEQMGMRPKMIEQLTEVLGRENGFVLFSSMPANGLTATFSAALRLTDRYMRDFVSLQPKGSTEPLAENIGENFWDPSKDNPEQILQTLIRKDPGAIVMSELPSAAIVTMLCEQAASQDKLVISTVRAKEAVEALLRILLMKVPATVFAPTVSAVINQRLVRRLCEECKEEYEPSPALLKKLGIPAGRIDKLYKPADPAEQDKVCPNCNGIGYIGRIAIYEMLMVDDDIRNALIKQPKLDVLRQLARKGGNKNLQQEGIVLVAKGVTSVNELSRALSAK